MSNHVDLWPGEGSSQDDFEALFAEAAAPVTGEIVDRHGFVSYGLAEQPVGVGRDPWLDAIGVQASRFLERCDPEEWLRLHVLRERAARQHGRDRLQIMVTSEKGSTTVAPIAEAAALKRLGLTVERARELCSW